MLPTRAELVEENVQSTLGRRTKNFNTGSGQFSVTPTVVSQTGGSFQACSFYKNADVDKLLDELRVTTDAKKAETMVAEIQTKISTDAPDIPIYVSPNVLGFNKKVKGFKYFGDISVDFWRLWIDEAKA